MNHHDHVELLRGGVIRSGGIWADLGCGTGAFTLALAELISSSGEIHAVDRDSRALRALEQSIRQQFPLVRLTCHTTDFSTRLELPPLDGVVMANSLHFVRDKSPVLALVRDILKPDGRLILVEYNADTGNPWVPYPIPYGQWELLAARAGFKQTRLLGRVPSRFLREIYSAVSLKTAEQSRS